MKRRNALIILSIVAFIVIIGGLSYSYFVYNKNIGDVALNTGEISLSLSNVSNDKTLTNVIPMSDNEGKVSQDYIDFTVDGTVDTERIYYEVYITPDSNNTMDADSIKVYLTDQNDNVIKGVTFYSSLSDAEKTGKRIYRTVIELNANQTTENYSKDFRLRIWIDENYTETTSKKFDFDINLYAYNVAEDYRISEALSIIKSNVITPTNPIHFANKSSSDNGEGLYILPGTENDPNPIYYYRGNIYNNNVIFGDFCWQIVRTTDTGGIKMIYNGEPSITGSGNNISYDCGITRPIQNKFITTRDLSRDSYYYADDYEIVSTGGNGARYRLKSSVNSMRQFQITSSTASIYYSSIISSYPYTCLNTTDTGTCTTLYKVDSRAGGLSANVYASTDISTIGRSVVNSQSNSISDVGYMYNERYGVSSSNWTTGALFASEAIWATDHYELTDASVTTPDATHHYSCNATTADATCTDLRYVYYSSGTIKYYITLLNGELIEDALYKMTGNGSNETKQNNSGYILNKNDSIMKTTIETWFETNLTNEVDNTKTDYRPYIEDTIYCNDRSYKTVSGSLPTFEQSGWNPNTFGTSGNGVLTNNLYFGSANRVSNGWYSATNVPSVACPNETDRFSVSSGVAHLNYPVGLLTADEIIMAGAAVGGASNSAYYLYTGGYYDSMSPKTFNGAGAFVENFYIIDNGSMIGGNSLGSVSQRPVISLKPGIEFETGGDGTPTNPYVVKYN